MSLVSGILKHFSSEMSPEDELAAKNQLSAAEDELSTLETTYTTYKDAESLASRLAQIDRELKNIHIPKKHPLFPQFKCFRDRYKDLTHEVEQHNLAYMDREKTLYYDLLANIDGKSLDPQQQDVVVCDEDRNLVLAGAGSGKTLTIAGKVKYLCTAKNVKPEDILLIAFTKKSAEEMTERIAKKLSIPIEASTFHKLGLDIITKATGKRPDVLDDLSDFIQDYFNNHIIDDPTAIKNLIEYFAYYLRIPANLEEFDSLGDAYAYEKGPDLETIKSKYDREHYVTSAAATRRDQSRTLRNERVKSMEEVTIANFLFLHGVNYEYESLYPYESDDSTRKAYRPDFYLPDYNIYLEHFGVNRDGKLPWLSPIEEQKYQQDMAWKRDFHKANGTTLIETYSYFSSDGVLLEKLDQLLKAKGIRYQEPDFLDIFRTVYAKPGEKYFSEFVRLCCTFITLFKSNGYKVDDLAGLTLPGGIFKKRFFVQRTNLFKDIVRPILEAYQQHLADHHAVDFADMIISAADLVTNGYDIPPYRWIIIDEFQDISVSRYKLVQAILQRTGAKLLCVGDDWQSIYRFAGSDISIFTGFEQYFGKAKIMRLEQTYRNSQQLIDVVGAFVMHNKQQLTKQLRSGKSLDYPITFMCYQDNPFPVLKRTVNKILHDFGQDASILFLGRTNYDVEMLQQSGLFTVHKSGKCVYLDSLDTPMRFLSVHKAKGLEAENVVLLNFQNSTLGFPNKIADDPILDLVLTTSDSYPYAEERRLLYVALTRTKNRVFVIADEKKPSEFMREFKPSKSVFILHSSKDSQDVIPCPRCKSGHLVTRKNNTSKRYFVSCSNYPQCQYTLNTTSVLENPRYCPECGGFMLKRWTKHGPFLGCSNYPLCSYTEQITTDKIVPNK